MTGAHFILVVIIGMMTYSIGSTVNNVGKVRQAIQPSVAAVAVIIMMLEIAGLVFVGFQL